MAPTGASVIDPLAQRPLLIGVVHLPALPGAPGAVPMGATLARAVSDAGTLASAGFGAVIVENFGDAPFHADSVPPETVAALAVACRVVREALPDDVAVGVNVLRNDALAGVAIAAAADLGFLRVNVLCGAYVTDQGLIEGRAAEVGRARQRLVPDLRVLADVRVKHAAPVAERPLEEEARDVLGRGGAHGIIVTGERTGASARTEDLVAVRAAVPGALLLAGSGVTSATVADVLQTADGVIVGTAIKAGGATTAPVDAERARAFVAAARG